MHLTLRFLGTTPPSVVPALPDLLRDAVLRCPPFRAPLLGLGLLPEQGHPRVLMVRIELPESAVVLQGACEKAVQTVGFPPEGRPFRPHLTLGRFPKPEKRLALPELDLGVAEFSELLFLESQLGPGGAVYRPLHRFALGKA